MILKLIYYMLPAFVANIAPVFGKYLIKNKTPLDLNKKIFKKRIFGDNKTWRGIILGTVLGTIMFIIQKLLYPHTNLNLINYSQYPIMLGFLLSFGALAGDALKQIFSF